MNAPFPPPAAQRDSFSAFVCDDHTLDIVRPVAGDLGWPVEKCHLGGLRGAVQQLAITASPNILVIDLSDSADPLDELNNLAEVCEPGTIVIALGQINDVRFYRELIISGIHDYLLKPFTADQMRDALIDAQSVLAGVRFAEPEAVQTHIACGVIGARGGCGASTLATSLAWLIGERLGHQTAVLDLDVHFGTGALSLDLEPGRGLTDAIENPGRIDGLFIERAMVRASDRLSILSAEASIEHPIMSDGTAYQQLLDELHYAYEVTLVDLPRQSLILYPRLLEQMTRAILVTQFTLAAARDTIRLLSWLKTHAPALEIILVADRVPQGICEISRADFESSIERRVDFLVPEDPRLFAEAAKQGKCVAEIAKGHKIGAVLEEIARRIGPAGEETADAKAKGASLLGKLKLPAMRAKRAA